MRVQYGAEIGEATQGLGAARALLLVAHQPQDAEARVGTRAQALDHGPRQLAPAHHEGVALVVAAATRNAEHLTKGVAREGHGSDGEDPEVDDDYAGVVVLTEEEGHHADEDEGAYRGGLGDVRDLGEARADATGPVEIEGAEGYSPHHEDGDQHEEVGLHVWDAVARGRARYVEAD